MSIYTDYIPDQHLDQGLKTWTVIRENEDKEWSYFLCEAEDADHAEEQSIDADPDYPILWVNRGLNFSMEDVYNVTISCTITKTYQVNASSNDEAEEAAHEMFNVLYDGIDEKYEQSTVSVEKVEHDDA